MSLMTEIVPSQDTITLTGQTIDLRDGVKRVLRRVPRGNWTQAQHEPGKEITLGKPWKSVETSCGAVEDIPAGTRLRITAVLMQWRERLDDGKLEQDGARVLFDVLR